MNIYTIAVPGQQPVDVQGISIRTQNVATPAPILAFWGLQAQPPSGATVAWVKLVGRINGNNPGSFFQYAGSPGWCRAGWNFNVYDGSCRIQQASGNTGFTANYQCNSFGLYADSPIGCGVSRCDIIVTVQSSPLQEITLQGLNGQPCGTWTTRSLDDCRDTEIKCVDLSDPRGFCCIPCDSLNSKIRALI